MKQIEVKLQRQNQDYSILIANSLLSNEDLINSTVKERQVCIVSNQNIYDLYAEKIKNGLKNRQIIEVILPEGEEYKNISSWGKILDAMMQNRFARDSAILALGGGVIGDLAGFAAASFQRGVAVYQVPTSLLAQVDSSIGGKTGVNHELGKNMIGAFWQPKAVLIDPEVLRTLPEREFTAGMGEVIKYGLINNLEFFKYLEENFQAINNKNPEHLAKIITTSAQAKVDIVQADEFEGGKRALLNLGHTFGHALETLGNYTLYKHGEAVAIGIRIAAELAAIEQKISDESRKRICQILTNFNLPISYQNKFQVEDIYQAMFADKKVRAGKLRLVKFREFCNCEVSADSKEKDILEAINLAK
ncbi:MAG: 3-dehydroquinate synthase [Cardiobacteriaceae bacterium]|nr:3-dehydroquinate synthase [Cardiobacteriaceae bacterium]